MVIKVVWLALTGLLLQGGGISATLARAEGSLRMVYGGGVDAPPGVVAVGDMLLPLDLHHHLTNTDTDTSSRKGVAMTDYLWPEERGLPTVPYVFDASKYKSEIEAGMRHWQEHTCLRFRQATEDDQHSVSFVRENGCWSFVGMQQGPAQKLSIGDGCQSLRTVVHEMGHALGLFHEHMRPERDRYLHVIDSNIMQENRDQFTKVNTSVVDDRGVQYDYTSVMQYNGLAFSKNGRLTLATREPGHQGLLGRAGGLTHRDKHIVNLMYGCIDKWMQSCGLSGNQCQGEGYVGPKCRCVCPPGRGGDLCEEMTGDYYSDMMPACSQVIGDEVTFTSPDYPGPVPQDSWCVFKVEAPIGQVVEVTFRRFHLYKSASDWPHRCYNDFLEIRDSALYDGEMFCDKDIKTNQSFVSTNREMYLYLDVLSSKSEGFRAEVKFHNASNPPEPKPGGAGGLNVNLWLQVCFMLVVHFTYDLTQEALGA